MIDTEYNTQRSGLSMELEKIAKYLKQLRFKKKLFGVDEADVWKKIEKLNEMYEAAVTAERERYNILLEEKTRQLRQELLSEYEGKGVSGSEKQG